MQQEQRQRSVRVPDAGSGGRIVQAVSYGPHRQQPLSADSLLSRVVRLRTQETFHLPHHRRHPPHTYLHPPQKQDLQRQVSVKVCDFFLF